MISGNVAAARAGAYTWSKVSGPGTVIFSPSASAQNPTFSADEAGEYKVQVQYLIGGATAMDTSQSIYAIELEITELSGDEGLYEGVKFCFSGAAGTTETGTCTINAEGTTGVAALDQYLQWSLDSIQGSALTADPANATGDCVSFEYETLPEDNDEFGTKTLTLSFPLIQNCSVTRDVAIFYPSEAKNWPGAAAAYPPSPHLGPLSWYCTETNYFHYYSQTHAKPEGGVFFYCKNGSECNPLWGYYNYPAHIGNVVIRGHEMLAYTAPGTQISIVLSGKTLYGIDAFAMACRHESKHSWDYSGWFPEVYYSPDDADGDHMLDSAEPDAEPVPFDNENPHTYDVPGENDDFDDQMYCMFTHDSFQPLELQPEFVMGDFTDEDWAYPGSQWR